MLPGLPGLLAVALAAAATDAGERAAGEPEARPPSVTASDQGPRPSGGKLGMPPVPGVLVRETRTFGNVTIDHRRHLSLRAPCARCHGDGPVTTIQFTPRVAHQRCVGCHKERQAGPTECRGCHVDREPPPAFAPAVATSEVEAAAEPDLRPGSAWAGLAAARAPSVEPAASHVPGAPLLVPPLPEAERPPVIQALSFAGASSPTIGFGLHVTSRRGRGYRSYGVERFEDGDSARLLALVDVGEVLHARGRWEVIGCLAGGAHAQERPSVGLSPTIGARLRAEWAPPLDSPVHRLFFALSAVQDLPVGAIGDKSTTARVFGSVGVTVAVGH